MNDEYQERGLFKQLVLIMFLAWAWLGHKFERLWHSEKFWWAVSITCVLIVALFCLKCAIVK